MRLENILKKAENEMEFTENEILFLLERTDLREIERIFETARQIRDRTFNQRVFLYGFVLFSTYCRNDCSFCYYRSSNHDSPKYRKTSDQIVAAAISLQRAGVHLIDLTMGEDPFYLNNPAVLQDLVRQVKTATGLPIMVSPGVVNSECLKGLSEAGADWYALYQETHNHELFQKLRLHQDYRKRFAAKECALVHGMLIEEGLLVGVGNSKADTAQSLKVMKSISASQVRAMTFVPQQGTPLEKCKPSSFNEELLTMAVMRLVFHKALIPASLDVDGLKGLEQRLNAGANVVTSIIPSLDGFMGVANATTDILEGYRTVEGIQETMTKCGVSSATVTEYDEWILNEKARLSRIEVSV